jgi:hypothetical protein
VRFDIPAPVHLTSFMTAEGNPECTLFDRREPKGITLGCRSGVPTGNEETLC